MLDLANLQPSSLYVLGSISSVHQLPSRQGALSGAFQGYHHHCGDQQLGLEQQLVDATIHGPHGQHLQKVSEGIPQTNDDENEGKSSP
jgi:hypothetical protein